MNASEVKTSFVSAFLSVLDNTAAAEKAFRKVMWPTYRNADELQATAKRLGREFAEKSIRVAAILKASK